MTPWSRKSGYTALDISGREPPLFLAMLKQKNQESIHLTATPAIAIDWAWSNKSGGSLWCSRESVARVENSVTETLPKKNRQNSRSKAAVWSLSFQWRFYLFIFLARGKANLLGGGTTSKLASQYPSWSIYKHAPPAFWRNRRLLYWKKGGRILVIAS